MSASNLSTTNFTTLYNSIGDEDSNHAAVEHAMETLIRLAVLKSFAGDEQPLIYQTQFVTLLHSHNAFKAALNEYLRSHQNKGVLSPTDAIKRTAIIIDLFKAKQNFLRSSASWIELNADHLKNSSPNEKNITAENIDNAINKILAISEKKREEAKTSTVSVLRHDRFYF
jgi:hypothetical protein